MTQFGYTLSSEEHSPVQLVNNAVDAERAGFDYLSISDHYHPWTTSQGNAGFVWAMLGGIAARTSHVQLAVGVTCPIVRIHPAIVAQAAATVQAMCGGRFVMGVGTGELLNEHITGCKWPPIGDRRQMLSEAVGIMRDLWQGERVDHEGKYFTVEAARLFTVPDNPPPILVSAYGPSSAKLAATLGDGLWSTKPDRAIVDTFSASGGTGPRFAEITVCWAEDRDQAIALARSQWPNAALPGQLAQDLPTWAHFEQAATLVTDDAVAREIPCGPDPEPIMEAISTYVDAGFDHIHLHQIGPDQAKFLQLWENRLAPRL